MDTVWISKREGVSRWKIGLSTINRWAQTGKVRARLNDINRWEIDQADGDRLWRLRGCDERHHVPHEEKPENPIASRFNFEGRHPIRVVSLDGSGEAWFVLADVCRVLGISNPSDVARVLQERAYPLDQIEGVYGPTNITTREGIFCVLNRSDKPEALRFQDWINKEVLPEIADTGSYSVEPQPTTTAQMLVASANLHLEAEEERKYLRAQLADQGAAQAATADRVRRPRGGSQNNSSQARPPEAKRNVQPSMSPPGISVTRTGGCPMRTP